MTPPTVTASGSTMVVDGTHPHRGAYSLHIHVDPQTGSSHFQTDIQATQVLQDHKPTSLPIPTTSNPFIVGAQSRGLTAWFHGQLDEVAVYGTALSPARIQAHYNVGIGLAP